MPQEPVNGDSTLNAVRNPDFWAKYFRDRADAREIAGGLKAYDQAVIQYQPNGRMVQIQRAKPKGGETNSEGRNKEEVDEVVRGLTRGLEQRGGGKRGKVKGFSRQSRRRLMCALSELKREAEPLFITLTYHKTCPSCEEAKQHLHALTEAFRRKFNGSWWGFFWKMEPQERGVPHFHLALYGPSWLPMQWLKRTWHRITDETSEEHRQQGAMVERPRKKSDVLDYLAKYVYKDGRHKFREEEWGEEVEWTGRVWGRRNREGLPVAAWVTAPVRLHWAEAYDVIEDQIAEWRDGELPQYVPDGLRISTNDPMKWLDEHLP